jgi:acyl carrier protein
MRVASRFMPLDDSRVARAWLALPRPYVAPRNPTETRLAAIWADALTLDCVGVDDDFADLGGDSFDAERVLTMVEAEFAVRAPLSMLIEATTVAGLAKAIERLSETRR